MTTESMTTGADAARVKVRRMSRILVIEDESRISDFVVRGLSEEGYRVEHAADGVAGWTAMQASQWDLILLDWWLPGEDGIHLLRRFRQKNRSTPVMLLTARDAVPQRVEGLDAGADDYMCKPFSFEELLARVRVLLRRPGQDSLTLEYSDIRADLASQRVSRGGQSIDLTAKEFLLLTLFLRNPGVVLSRTRIFDSVWGEQYDGSSNTLEVHIKELRRKLEVNGPRVIQTRRGSGYMLDAAPGDEV
ncbi:Response regulator MprA [Caulifigura coniformis]|uniref:Response regulator MprA n=2 Tax=Caulifigura coniformis TaxID=2527983 RepID=A0A517SDB8_9PLAN|nr:response regulator transcription factor [Caulifigura coniformis]QDT54119.1 Response regulator MprA [Caulifigura coniformis]